MEGDTVFMVGTFDRGPFNGAFDGASVVDIPVEGL
jgi:hypothetical protein